MGISKFTLARISGYVVFWLRIGSRTLPLAIPWRTALFYLESAGKIVSIGETGGRLGGGLGRLGGGLIKNVIKETKNVIKETPPVSVWQERQQPIFKKTTSLALNPCENQQDLLHAGVGIVQNVEIIPNEYGYNVTVVFQLPASELAQFPPGTAPSTMSETFFLTQDQLQAFIINAKLSLEDDKTVLIKSDFTSKGFKDWPRGPGAPPGGGASLASISMSSKPSTLTQAIPTENTFFVQNQKLIRKVGVSGVFLILLIAVSIVFKK